MGDPYRKCLLRTNISLIIPQIVQRTAIHGETNKLLLGYALQSIVEVMEPMPDQWGYVINNNIIKKVGQALHELTKCSGCGDSGNEPRVQTPAEPCSKLSIPR